MVFIKATKNLFKIPNANYEKDEQNSLRIESILTYDHFLVTCEELNDETIKLRRSVSYQMIISHIGGLLSKFCDYKFNM